MGVARFSDRGCHLIIMIYNICLTEEVSGRRGLGTACGDEDTLTGNDLIPLPPNSPDIIPELS